MSVQTLAVIVTMGNLGLTAVLLSQAAPATAQDVPTVLRARSLEIVDADGRVRASIRVEPSTTVAGQSYPEAVVFRLRDAGDAAPAVKLDTSRDGAGLSLAGTNGRIALLAKRGEQYISVATTGRGEQIVKP